MRDSLVNKSIEQLVKFRKNTAQFVDFPCFSTLRVHHDQTFPGQNATPLTWFSCGMARGSKTASMHSPIETAPFPSKTVQFVVKLTKRLSPISVWINEMALFLASRGVDLFVTAPRTPIIIKGLAEHDTIILCIETRPIRILLQQWYGNSQNNSVNGASLALLTIEMCNSKEINYLWIFQSFWMWKESAQLQKCTFFRTNHPINICECRKLVYQC